MKQNYVQRERWGVLDGALAIRMNGKYKAPETSAATTREMTIGKVVFNS